MPRRPDLERVLVIGAGPIIIGQACEFDYSGSQACRTLRQEGLQVVLLNSNPATIMTDPDMADATYVEPITPEIAHEIIRKESVDTVLPTLGGQTALNCAMGLHRLGVFASGEVRLIGANFDAIEKAENRERFKELMGQLGLGTPRSGQACTLAEARAVATRLGCFPLIIRPSFTLGGTGGGIANDMDEFIEICQRGLNLSPTNQLLIEESLTGWKEYELEVVRDRNDNCIVVCGIENVDPLGVHTGDSVTIAPILTLTDREYQHMRDASFKVLRAIGVDTGGANVQFAVNPADGRLVVIEMNPRVSRSSALASKATGFPIAKVSTKLALGYTLDELRNEITGGLTPASFEPTIDYVVAKIPRFNFDKFPQTPVELGTQMRSVGEAMAIGRTWREAVHKALSSLEDGTTGLDPVPGVASKDDALERLGWPPEPGNLLLAADALRHGATIDEVHAACRIDRWFLSELAGLLEVERGLAGRDLDSITAAEMLALKRDGFSDRRLATLLGVTEGAVRDRRAALGVHATFHRVDSCAAEFPTTTAYMYSTYGEECESAPTDRDKYMILGSGPNRIGQGIEFDYCCIHAALALREAGHETIMVNCNPETVSTDYDISDRLYFEPLTTEHVLEILRIERPKGVIVQYGGQTPLRLAQDLEAAGWPIIGTPVDAIDRAEDRDRFRTLLGELGLRQPDNAIATTAAQGLVTARELGYPLVVRPSYVLGGRAMEIIHDDAAMEKYLTNHERTDPGILADGLLLDRFLDRATELDVDLICDGTDAIIAGTLEHVEKAGVHSGDSSCALPPHTISATQVAELGAQAKAMALELGVRGLMNVQFAIQDGAIYVLEINPRASRTVPFISKALGWPVAKIGALVMAGATLAELGVQAAPAAKGHYIKEAVFPFDRMPRTSAVLGPEMRSTGEVMGCGNSYHAAFVRAIEAALGPLPTNGELLLTVHDRQKGELGDIARTLLTSCPLDIVATPGTAAYLRELGLEVPAVAKASEQGPTVIDRIKDGHVKLVINIVSQEAQAKADAGRILREALARRCHYFTTIDSARIIATCLAQRTGEMAQVTSLQERHA